MLNVYHSIDGKDFITEKQIDKEIYDELYVHDGRINIVALQTLLNVDISHIELRVGEIVKNDTNLHLILGQIISKDYMNKISEDINELLQERGSVSITELTNIYELPADFLNQIVAPRVGSIIKGNFDGKIIYTFEYVNRQKAILVGALEACIKPVRFSQIIKEHNLDAGMIFENFDELLASGHLNGALFGGRQEMSAVFVPAFYSKAQQQYVESFFKQNGFVDFSLLKKIGITENAESYMKALCPGQTIKYMSGSCFTPFFVDQIEQELDDHLNRVGFCDLSQLLPPSLNEKDSKALTVTLKDNIKQSVDTELMSETYLVKKDFLKTLGTKLSSKMEEKAVDDLKKPNFVLAIRTEHAVVSMGAGSSSNEAGSKASGGKAAKSGGKAGKGKSAAQETADETMLEINFIDKADLIRELTSLVKDLAEDLHEPMVEYFLKPLNHQYFDLLKNKIEMGLVSSSTGGDEDSPGKESSSAGSPSKKNTIKDVQERIKTFLLNAKIFEKGLKSMNDPKVQEMISKHLIKTICTDIVNDMLRFLGHEQMIAFNEDNMTSEVRTKIIQKLKDPHKQRFQELSQALVNKTSNEVIDLVEKSADSFELSIKKNDTKREKEILLQLRESTKASLEAEKDAATVLQLTAILLYQQSTGQMVNAPGRCVPNIIENLRPSLSEEVFGKLIDFQNLVIETISKAKTDPTALDSISVERIGEIRSIGLDAKSLVKSAAAK